MLAGVDQRGVRACEVPGDLSAPLLLGGGRHCQRKEPVCIFIKILYVSTVKRISQICVF